MRQVQILRLMTKAKLTVATKRYLGELSPRRWIITSAHRDSSPLYRGMTTADLLGRKFHEQLEVSKLRLENSLEFTAVGA